MSSFRPWYYFSALLYFLELLAYEPNPNNLHLILHWSCNHFSDAEFVYHVNHQLHNPQLRLLSRRSSLALIIDTWANPSYPRIHLSWLSHKNLVCIISQSSHMLLVKSVEVYHQPLELPLKWALIKLLKTFPWCKFSYVLHDWNSTLHLNLLFKPLLTHITLPL